MFMGHVEDERLSGINFLISPWPHQITSSWEGTSIFLLDTVSLGDHRHRLIHSVILWKISLNKLTSQISLWTDHCLLGGTERLVRQPSPKDWIVSWSKIRWFNDYLITASGLDPDASLTTRMSTWKYLVHLSNPKPRSNSTHPSYKIPRTKIWLLITGHKTLPHRDSLGPRVFVKIFFSSKISPSSGQRKNIKGIPIPSPLWNQP